MKKYVFFLMLSSIKFYACAQEQRVNPVTLSLKSGDTIVQTIFSKALISIKDGSQHFQAAIELFPIVPNPDAEDSLEQQNKPLVLKLDGQFPVTNMNFLTSADNGKSYTMQVNARLNDSTQSIPLTFALIVLRDAPIDPNGNVPRYNAKISFAFILSPKLFGLDNPPFSINKLILLQASEAVISKLSW